MGERGNGGAGARGGEEMGDWGTGGLPDSTDKPQLCSLYNIYF